MTSTPRSSMLMQLTPTLPVGAEQLLVCYLCCVAGAFMEKQLTMRGGQTPVQRYWPVLLPKVMSGVCNMRMVKASCRTYCMLKM
jgi:hypothetical protein